MSVILEDVHLYPIDARFSSAYFCRMEKVNSVDHLKQLAYRENGDYVQFYIFLAVGVARSGKMISYRPN